MSKVYVYYYDNRARILVGSGGTTGNPPQRRLGFHLPGGTAWRARRIENGIGRGIGRGVEMPRIHVLSSAFREVREEFGAVRAALVEAATLGMGSAVNSRFYGDEVVYFVGVQLTTATIDNMVGDITDGIGAPTDSPFEECIAMYAGIAKQSFNASGNDWFADGLRFLPIIVP